MINGILEEQYEQIAAGLDALAHDIGDDITDHLVIETRSESLKIDLGAPFMRRYWIIQLRVIQNQIEQRANGSLDYPPQ